MASYLPAPLNNFLQFARGCNPAVLTLSDDDRCAASLKDKWIVISGANNGVGFEAARDFAAWGAHLVLACRDNPPAWERHPEAAAQELRAIADARGHRSSVIEWWAVDMADLASVEAFARRWLASGRVLDVLCNNAGVPTLPLTRSGQRARTKDGFDVLHQVNLMSHVLLTLHLLPSLARSANNPRVVCTTSNLHHMGVLDLEHFDCEPGMRGGDYPNNKLYLQMWVAELQARLRAAPPPTGGSGGASKYAHVTVVGVHPGYVASGIWAALDQSEGLASRVLVFLAGYLAITPRQGGLALSRAAANPDPGAGGKYFNRIWEAPARPDCDDLGARARLWAKLDEELRLGPKGLLSGLGP